MFILLLSVLFCKEKTTEKPVTDKKPQVDKKASVQATDYKADKIKGFIEVKNPALQGILWVAKET